MAPGPERPPPRRGDEETTDGEDESEQQCTLAVHCHDDVHHGPLLCPRLVPYQCRAPVAASGKGDRLWVGETAGRDVHVQPGRLLDALRHEPDSFTTGRIAADHPGHPYTDHADRLGTCTGGSRSRTSSVDRGW